MKTLSGGLVGAGLVALGSGQINFLARHRTEEIIRVVNEIYVRYDQVVQQCAVASAHHLKADPLRDFLARREIVAQLKEVARCIRVSAGSLEDLTIKTV